MKKKYRFALTNNINDVMFFFSTLDNAINMYLDGDKKQFIIEVE